MDNRTQTNASSSSTSMLVIGIILGVLILGGIFLYMRATPASAPTVAPENGIEADVNIPIRNDAEQTQGQNQ
jgi:hypothetical protein